MLGKNASVKPYGPGIENISVTNSIYFLVYFGFSLSLWVSLVFCIFSRNFSISSRLFNESSHKRNTNEFSYSTSLTDTLSEGFCWLTRQNERAEKFKLLGKTINQRLMEAERNIIQVSLPLSGDNLKYVPHHFPEVLSGIKPVILCSNLLISVPCFGCLPFPVSLYHPFC